MLKIRLRRMGAIRQPHYRIVVTDARSPRDGHFIETLGHYNPLTNPATIQVDVAKYEEWRKKGAQPTEAVVSLVRQFNRTARQAAAAVSEGATAQQPTRKTRARATTPDPATTAAVEASEATEATEATTDTDVPMNEAVAEASRDGGEGSEAITEAAPAEDATTEATEATDATTEA
ncbi:MAG TPA: 30S ribosomal protein S16 [Chloroflexia bacterium]|nr:30S ribosomal protein S16 [Chloroflexia bacterium]